MRIVGLPASDDDDAITKKELETALAAVTGGGGGQGPAGTVAVGTVTTGAAGSQVQVANSGTPSAAVLDFTIPRGDPGTAGTAGTVAVGTVTTGAAGGAVSVVNTGSPTAAVLDFIIPKGDPGADAALPAGGSTGQALLKASPTDGDAGWGDVRQVPAAAAAGQLLTATGASTYVWAQAPKLTVVTASDDYTAGAWEMVRVVSPSKNIAVQLPYMAPAGVMCAVQKDPGQAYTVTVTAGNITYSPDSNPGIDWEAAVVLTEPGQTIQLVSEGGNTWRHVGNNLIRHRGAYSTAVRYTPGDIVSTGGRDYLAQRSVKQALPGAAPTTGPGKEWAQLSSNLPTGGTTGQALLKASTADGDAGWGDVRGVPAGGGAGQVVTATGTAGGYAWQTPAGLTRVAASSAYTAGANEHITCTANAPFTVTLPDLPAGSIVAVHKTDTSFNAVTIVGTGEAFMPKVLDLPGQHVTYLKTAATGGWQATSWVGDMRWRGSYEPTTTYGLRDVVLNNGMLFLRQEVNPGTGGITNPAVWLPISSGLTGAVTITTAPAPAAVTLGYIYLANANSAAFTFTLPAVASLTVGAMIAIRKVDASTNAVTIAANGAAYDPLAPTQLNRQGDGIVLLYSGGTYGWVQVGASGSAPRLTPVVKTAAYTPISGELVLADAATVGAFTVTLPTGVPVGTTVGVRKVDTGTNTVTVSGAGTVFENTAPWHLAEPGMSIIVMWTGTTYGWLQTGGSGFMRYRGTWASSGIAYAFGDWVMHFGQLYRCVYKPGGLIGGGGPDSTAANWQPLTFGADANSRPMAAGASYVYPGDHVLGDASAGGVGAWFPNTGLYVGATIQITKLDTSANTVYINFQGGTRQNGIDTLTQQGQTSKWVWTGATYGWVNVTAARGLRWRGGWTNGPYYYRDDQVTYLGSTYVCTAVQSSGQVPAGGADWVQIPRGARWFSGAGAPDATALTAQGALVGDWYLDTASTTFYELT